MRILYINTSSGWGGMEMHPLVVAEELARRGNPVLFAMKQGSPMQAHAGSRGFTPLFLPFRWYLDPGSFPVMRRMVESFRINVIHVHASRDAWRSLLLAGLFRKRTVFVLSRHLGSPAGKRKDDPLHRMLVQRADAVVAISTYIRENIRKIYPVPDRKVRVIPYGLGKEVIGDPEQGRVLRQQLGVPTDGPLVGMAAQMTPDKRQDLFVRAAARVLEAFPACRFVLAGAPVHTDFTEKIRRLIVNLGMEKRVVLAGHLRDIPAFMRALDVFVLPSKAEAFGLVLLEAMANSRCIVGSDSGAVPEIVKHERNGLLFQPGSPDALAEALITLLGSKERRDRMGKEGKRLFDREYSLEREAQETEALYRSLLGSAGIE